MLLISLTIACVPLLLQCFNFEPLVRSMERACPGTYRCPMCRAPLTLDELVVRKAADSHNKYPCILVFTKT
jgi:hypothetical protein